MPEPVGRPSQAVRVRNAVMRPDERFSTRPLNQETALWGVISISFAPGGRCHERIGGTAREPREHTERDIGRDLVALPKIPAV